MAILGDGACHSGNELGQYLSITRTAVWKQISQLVEVGIPIHRKAHQGYQLNKELILLNNEQIRSELGKSAFPRPYTLHLFTLIDSTNRFLKELAPSNQVEICCAEQQSQGRGRFGRHWHSPFGENIYCSSRWSFNTDLSKLSGLSLVVSLAVFETISQLINCADIKIKWPNDILWKDKKLSGCLIEIVAESNGNCQVVIGIGLNVNTDTLTESLEDKPWCSLFEISNKSFNRNIIIASLLKNLEYYLRQFSIHGLEPFLDQWNKHDYLAAKEICITQAANTCKGVALGINSLGQLILEDRQGRRQYLSSGDTSLQTTPFKQ